MPTGSAEAVDLDVARQLGELVGMEQPSPVRVERLQERCREAAGRAETRAGRNVGECGDLDLRRPEVEFEQRLANEPVLHVIDPLDVLELRVLQEDARREGPHHGDVDVLVDRRRDQEPAVVLVVGRQVGAAAAKRDPQRTAGDDHRWRGQQ